MKEDKQTLLVSYLISSVSVLALTDPIIKPEYFDDSLKDVVKFIQKYYHKFRGLPDPDQIFAETGRKIKTTELDSHQEQYALSEIENFVKREAFKSAIIDAADHIQENKYDEIFASIENKVRDALLVSLEKDLGVDVFHDASSVLHRMTQSEIPLSTGYDDIDEMLNGGFVRKQLALFSANSGGGKSVLLANLGINYALQGYNVLVLSLELKEELVFIRLATMLTDVKQKNWRNELGIIARRINNYNKAGGVGSLIVKRLPGQSNANDFRAYLKEYELVNGFVPDVLIVDYLDKMGTVERLPRSDMFVKDQAASEELYELGSELNALVITASQQNRGALTMEKKNQSVIAGGISKINEADVYGSIISDDIHRDNGDFMIKWLKTRTSAGVGKISLLKWNPDTLRISNFTAEERASREELLCEDMENLIDDKLKKMDDFDEDVARKEQRKRAESQLEMMRDMLGVG